MSATDIVGYTFNADNYGSVLARQGGNQRLNHMNRTADWPASPIPGELAGLSVVRIPFTSGSSVRPARPPSE